MWKDKVVLREGEKLEHQGSKVSGFMGETDIDTYAIVDANGIQTGTVVVEDHTAVKGFKRTITVTQTNLQGEEVGRSIVEPK